MSLTRSSRKSGPSTYFKPQLNDLAGDIELEMIGSDGHCVEWQKDLNKEFKKSYKDSLRTFPQRRAAATALMGSIRSPKMISSLAEVVVNCAQEWEDIGLNSFYIGNLTYHGQKTVELTFLMEVDDVASRGKVPEQKCRIMAKVRAEYTTDLRHGKPTWSAGSCGDPYYPTNEETFTELPSHSGGH